MVTENGSIQLYQVRNVNPAWLLDMQNSLQSVIGKTFCVPKDMPEDADEYKYKAEDLKWEQITVSAIKD